MDIFKSLTGGAKFTKDTNKFNTKPSKASTSTNKASTSASTSSLILPTELDFFGTSTSTTDSISERANAKKMKKRKRAEDAAATAIESGIDYQLLLKQNKIKFTGLDSPNPIISLAELSLKLPQHAKDEGRLGLIIDNWNKMGLKKPTSIQMASWGVMLEKRDLLACAPTGSGKTLAFLLPLLLLLPPSSSTSPASSNASTSVLKPNTLILEPTRELALQVSREALNLSSGTGIKVTVLGEEERELKLVEGGGKVVSGKKKWSHKKKGKKAAVVVEKEENEEGSDEEEDEVEDVDENEVKSIETDILITTPLRLIFAIKAGTVDLSSVTNLILDESDKLFELNFLSQTDEIISACSNPNLKKGMFSATMSSTVEEMAASVMSGGAVGLIRVIVGQKDAATETIEQSLKFVGEEDHKLASLRSIISSGTFTPPVLIFVQSILRAKELANELLFDGINSDCIHAERSLEERDNAIKGFAEGKIWCLICTDVMARGVDFKGVNLVINYDFPQSGAAYIHRIGRTGRAGKEGKAITFFTKDDAVYLKSIVNVMISSGCPVPAFMLNLKPPTKDLKKKLKLKPLNRKDVRQTNGAGHDGKLGRKELGKRKRVIVGAGVGGKGEEGEKRKRVKGAEKEVGMDE